MILILVNARSGSSIKSKYFIYGQELESVESTKYLGVNSADTGKSELND